MEIVKLSALQAAPYLVIKASCSNGQMQSTTSHNSASLALSHCGEDHQSLAWLGNKYSDRDYLAILSAGFWLRCPEAIKKSKSQFKQLNRNQICGKLPTHEVNQYSDIWPQWLLWSNDAGSVGRGGNRSWQGDLFWQQPHTHLGSPAQRHHHH